MQIIRFIYFFITSRMREIKFRWRNSKHKKRIYGDLFRSHWERFITQDWIVDNPLAEPEDWRVEPETVGQSTWLEDKNGNEIYEGDIIKYSGNSRYWTVYWNEVVWQFRFKCYGFVSKSYWDYAFHSALEYRIVGNIYENPELINQ